MTGSQRDAGAGACRHRASAVVWNVVVPALGLVLILGAPILGALAIAAVASVAAPGAARAPFAVRSPARREPRARRRAPDRTRELGPGLGHAAAGGARRAGPSAYIVAECPTSRPAGDGGAARSACGGCRPGRARLRYWPRCCWPP